MILASAVVKMISLKQLLSTCMDASRQGCEIIREFHRSGDVTGTLKVGNEIKSVVTQADLDAQAAIVGGLRRVWGDRLRIVGEEDGNDVVTAPPIGDDDEKHFRELMKNLLDENNEIADDEEMDLDDVVLWVDPLDGTREFVEGRLENVASLVGIARKNRPVAGVIGLPFPIGEVVDDDPGVSVHYAVADRAGSAGCWWPTARERKEEKIPEKSTPETGTITILTGDSTDPVLLNATEAAKSLLSTTKAPLNNFRHVIVGGTAAKLRRVATEPDSLAVLHFKTELWDTCAPQAVIENSGGKVTDLFGAPLVHGPANRPFGNVFGVVASSGGGKEISRLHDDLCAKMRADAESVHRVFGKWMGPPGIVPECPQAVDVARDLDGIPFTVQEIEREVLGREHPNAEVGAARLRSYSVPESGVWRGMMSTGGRFLLDWEDGSGEENGAEMRSPQQRSHPLPSSVFYKRIVMADLAHARGKLTDAPHKLIRDVRSYQVETSFLTGRACENLIRETGLRINRVFGADLRPAPSHLGPREQLESRFSVLLEDFEGDREGWKQQWLLSEEATRASLDALAKMHAYFWTGSRFWKVEGGQLGEELHREVWPNGGYMQPKMQGYDQLSKVASGWGKRYPSFRDALEGVPELKGADLADLGERLEKVASIVGERSHPFGHEPSAKRYDQYRTLIHGDPKQANLFFRERGEECDGEGDNPTLEVGLIDFQWSGFGLAATDVAHHISAAVSPVCLSRDGAKERRLLDYYHSSLARALVRSGVATCSEEVELTVFSRAVLQEQYEIALLDVARMVFAYAWRRWKEESHPTPESLNRNAYNKSLNSAVWLVARCHELLRSLEADLLGTAP